MEQIDGMVYLVEDDAHVRETLADLLSSMGWVVSSFESAAEFLAYVRPDGCACLILEMNLADVNGLELQRQLSVEMTPPIIFISDHSSVATTVSAMKAGGRWSSSPNLST